MAKLIASFNLLGPQLTFQRTIGKNWPCISRHTVLALRAILGRTRCSFKQPFTKLLLGFMLPLNAKQLYQPILDVELLAGPANIEDARPSRLVDLTFAGKASVSPNFLHT